MTRTARRASENLLSSIGSGGLPASNFQAPAEKPNRQACIDRSFANSAIWLGLSFGTGSLLMVPIAHADPATSTESCLVERLMRVPHQTATGRRARWKSQLEKIKSEFSIPMTRLAQFLNVERPTVYQWFGAAEPRQANLQRINTLAELADAWSDFQLGSIRPYLDRPVAGNGPSLDDLLSAPQLDSDLLASSFASAAASGRAVRDRDQFSLADRLAARGFSPYGEETQKRSRAGKISSTSPGEDSP